MLVLASIAVVLGGLYLARDVLIPVALAILLSFLLAPVVARLQKWGLPRILSVIAAVVVAMLVLGFVVWLVASQLVDLAGNLNAYRQNIQNRIASLQGSGNGPLGRAAAGIGNLLKDLTAALAPASTGFAIPVRPVTSANLLQTLGDFLGPVIPMVTTAGIVIVLVIFMLMQREDLRDRFIRLIGQGQLKTTTQAIDDAAGRVSRYLLMQSIINSSYGLVIGLGLALIGVRNAPLWGLLAAMLRFVPYVGPVIAMIMPILLSLAMSTGWSQPLLTIGLYFVVELWSNNFMEPWLYGSSTGMTNMAVLVAAVFWTWLWGPIGLVLATPLTVCLAVMGKYVPQLGFLNVLLSDEPALNPAARLYQRLLAYDQAEANELLEEMAEEKTLVELYDQMLLPALVLVEEDHHRGQLDEGRMKFVYNAVRDLINDAVQARRDALEKQPAAAKEGEEAAEPPAKPGVDLRVLALPSFDEADELAAQMLAVVMREAGYHVQVVSMTKLASEMLDTVADYHADIVCISAVPPSVVTHTRYLCKRLRQRFGDVPMLIGLWDATGDVRKLQPRICDDPNARVAATLAEAVREMQQIAQPLVVMKSEGVVTR